MATRAVYIKSTNCIGVILDEGEDHAGKWYRTDSDGIIEPSDLIFLQSQEEVKKCIAHRGAHIAPSTEKIIFSAVIS